MTRSHRNAFRCSITVVVMALLTGIVVRTTDAQTAQTKQVMQQKLGESQQLLAALVTSNWIVLGQRTAALQALTNQPGWQVLTTPEFRSQTGAFQRATQSLATAATQRDQRTALAAYNELVTSCVECHRYVARARIANAK
jgi:hypothetical protein